MGRSTVISRFFSVLRAGSAATIALATILSCSDSSTAPSANLAPSAALPNPALAGIRIIHFQVADSLKHPKPGASSNRTLGAMNISQTPTAAAKAVTKSIYTVTRLSSFNPEPKPVNQLASNSPNPEPICDDCVAIHVPIGFDFTFYGNSYSQLQISSNGLIKMGSDSSLGDACCEGRQIPFHDDFDNIIAVAWTDLSPSAPGDITFETQGVAPNRKFVVQWNNVSEFSNEVPGHVTAQVVLSEGSNDITINTLSEDLAEVSHVLTQGIENFDGTEAAFLPGRVGVLFGLSNDAVRFSIRPPYQPIKLVAAANLVLPTIPRACFGTVAPAQTQPTVTGGDEFLTVSARRSDELALDANYPKGATIITWSATDSTGGTVLATQTVAIADREAPQIFLPSNAVVRNDPGLATAFVNVGVGHAEDNCPGGVTLTDPPNGVYPVGTTPVVWTARDEAGNTTAATQLVTVKDVEAPTIVLPPAMTVNATSPKGAPVPFNGFGTDNVAVTSFDCKPVSGTQFPIGRTFASCSAVDAAGNKSVPAQLAVTVLGAPQQIDNLIASIRAVLPKGGEWDDDHHHGRRGHHQNELLRALLSPLGNSRNLRGACPALDMIAFIVRGNTPSIFPTANSSQILADIARIKNVIGCR